MEDAKGIYQLQAHRHIQAALPDLVPQVRAIKTVRYLQALLSTEHLKELLIFFSNKKFSYKYRPEEHTQNASVHNV